jgi:hypothetical protein
MILIWMWFSLYCTSLLSLCVFMTIYVCIAAEDLQVAEIKNEYIMSNVVKRQLNLIGRECRKLHAGGIHLTSIIVIPTPPASTCTSVDMEGWNLLENFIPDVIRESSGSDPSVHTIVVDTSDTSYFPFGIVDRIHETVKKAEREYAALV